MEAIADAKVDMKDLAVAVYGDTAIATFNGEFSGKFGGKPLSMKQAATLVFVKYKGDWKIVHEQFSPIGAPPSRGAENNAAAPAGQGSGRAQ